MKKESQNIFKKKFGFKYLVVSFVVGYLCCSAVVYTMSARTVDAANEIVRVPAKPVAATSPTAANAAMDALVAETTAHPSNPQVWTQLGNFYFDNGLPQEAINAYEKSIKLDPNNTNVIVDCGVMYRRVGNPQKANALFEEAHEIDPTHQKALYNIGLVAYFDLKDHEMAKKYWSRLIAVNPDAPGPGGKTLATFMSEMLAD